MKTGFGQFDYNIAKNLKRLDDLWQRAFDYRVTTLSPECDYVETDTELMIYLRAAGYGRDDLTVEVLEGTLRVHAELPEDRRVTRLIPNQIDYELALGSAYQIEEASHENGILTIRLSRTKKVEATKIPIQSRDR